MRPDHQEFTEGLKLTAIAVVSALLTATVVIGAGRAALHPLQAQPAQAASVAGLIPASTR